MAPRPARGLRRPGRGRELLAQLLRRGAFGTLVPAADEAALADAVERVLADPAGARARAQAGRAHVLAHHGVDRLVRDLDALYRELLRARGIA
jgi:glycosyltransferase involved in cell wall biosynthesis